MYRYGKGDYEVALELLGSEFNASNCKVIRTRLNVYLDYYHVFFDHDISVYLCQMIGASDEQLDVLNEMRYIMLLNTGRAKEGMKIILFLEYKF